MVSIFNESESNVIYCERRYIHTRLAPHISALDPFWVLVRGAADGWTDYGVLRNTHSPSPFLFYEADTLIALADERPRGYLVRSPACNFGPDFP